MKNIYDLFNNIDIDLNEYEELKIDDNEVGSIKNRISGKLIKNNDRKRKIYKPIAASMAGLLFVTALFNVDIVSANIDKVATTLRNYFTEKVDRDFSNYAINIGDTITDKDISVTLNELIVDNNLVMVNYNIDYSKLDKEDYINYDLMITVNGKKITGGIGIGPKKLSERVTNEVWIYTLDDLEVNEKLDVDVKYQFYDLTPLEDEKYLVEGETYLELIPIEGEWKYNFNISEENIEKTLKKVKLSENNIIEKDGERIKITEAIKSDLTLRIKYEYLDRDPYSGESTNGGGEDKNPYRIDNPLRPKYSVFDENGDGFKMYTRSVKDNKGEISYFINDSSLNKYTIVSPENEIILDFSE